MSRRPRTQAVPQTGSTRSRGKPQPAPSEPRSRRFGRGTTIIAVGVLLIVIGLASVVASMPAEPTPTPPAGPLPITFGRVLDPDTYVVSDVTNQFEPGDVFAYSVTPSVHPGVPNVYVAIVTFRAGQTVVLQPPVTPLRLLPEPVTFGYKTTVADLIELFGYGRFTMRIHLAPDGPVYAQGRFEVVEPSVPL